MGLYNNNGGWCWFEYDATGRRHSISIGGMVFYYYYNAQGDVMGLRNDSGQSVVQYTYDSWGKLLSTSGTMAGFINPYNPFRYRGYFYDEETGLYYLNSRYYDPETGRFLNADGYVSTGQGVLGNNIFAYCGNNPVNRADPTGMFWKEIGDFFSKAWNGVKTWAKNTFGAEARVTYQAKIEEELSPPIINKAVTLKQGTKAKKTVVKKGNSSKPISVYAEARGDNFLLSNAGFKINVCSFTFDFKLGLENAGLEISQTSGNTKTSSSFVADISQFKVGFENSVTIWDTDKAMTYFSNASFTAAGLVALYVIPGSNNVLHNSYAGLQPCPVG